MAETVDYFMPPEISKPGVLAHDLTPLPANACDAFIHAYVPDGGMVWDPFCRADTVAQAAIRQGKRALLSDFNPLIAFIVRSTMHQVSARQFDRAFSALAAAPTMSTSLDSHINSLYATTCPDCGTAAIVRSFAWSQETNRPISKEFHCLTCNTIRRDPMDEQDLSTLARIEEHGRAYWALLERLGASAGQLHPLADSLLNLYTARSVYALSMIQSKLEVMVADRETVEVLTLALLDTMERSIRADGDNRSLRQRPGSARPGSGERSSPEQPATFTEVNCWLIFVEACSAQRERLSHSAREGEFQRTASTKANPTPPKSTDLDADHVVVRQSPARQAAADLGEGTIDLILSAPPTIDTGDLLPLTFLWTGWLLGKDGAHLFSPDLLLHPRRANDWPWFYGAMERSFRAMVTTLKPDGKLIFCLPLTGLGYFNVLLLAATVAGLHLENIAYQPSSSESLRHPPALGATSGYCYVRFGRAMTVPAPSEAGVYST